MEPEANPSVVSSCESYLEIKESSTSLENPITSEAGDKSSPLLKNDKLPETNEKSIEINSVFDNTHYETIEASILSPDSKPDIIGSNEQLEAIKESFNMNPNLPWKQVILFHINEVVNQMLNHPRFRPNPGGPPSFYFALLKSSFSLENDAPKDSNFSSKISEHQGFKTEKKINPNNAPLTGQFGKLGKLINSQVFEFDQWDQYEEMKALKFPTPLQDLLDLRQFILRSEKLENISGVVILEPFLNLLSSGDSSGSIVSSSLSALDKFLSLGFLNPNTPQLPEALFCFSEALINCRFEIGDINSDEVVLLKLIQLMGALISNRQLILNFTTKHIEAIIRAAILVGCQLRLTPVVRDQTESVLRKTFTEVFKSLLSSCQLILVHLLEMVISLIEPNNTHHSNYTRLLGLGILSDLLVNLGSELFEEEILASMLSDKLCRYLWLLQDGEHLTIIARSLDLTSTLIHIAQSRLKQQQQLWIQQCMTRLVTLATSPLHTGSYRQNRDDEMAFLFSNFLLQFTHKTPTFFNELLVNFDCTLNQPSMALDLMNFIVDSSLRLSESQDGQSRQSNIWLDQIMKFLIGLHKRTNKNPENGILKQLTNFELLEKSNIYYSERHEGSHFQYCDKIAEELIEAQQNKKVIHEAVDLFNQKAWNGINYLIESQMLPPKDDADFCSRLSHFLHNTLGLNKRTLGDFLSKKDNVPILEAFIAEFDFSGKRIDLAMREFLTSFRLPGESQLISRIFEEFSEKYFSTNPEFIDTKDAVYLLAYSLLMVNTDLHSQQIKNKIQFPSFQRMHKNNNGGKDFEESFLREIYDSIARDEIILPEEQDGIVSREYTWKVFTENAAFKGLYYYCHPGQFDKEVFLMSANILTDLFVQTYSNSTSDVTLQISLQGLYLIVLLSDYYCLSDITDYVLRRMAMLTGTIFMSEENHDAIWSHQRTPVSNRTQQVDGSILSDLSLNLGQSYKSQLITVFLFNIAGQIPYSLFNSWWDILEMFKMFLDSFLLPSDTTEIPTLSIKTPPLSSSAIPFRPPVDAHLRSKLVKLKSNQTDNSHSSTDDTANIDDSREIFTSESSGGLFSTFSSLLGYPSQHPTLIWDSSPQLLFAYLDSVKKLVPACGFNRLISAISQLDDDNFEAVLKRIMILVKSQHAVSEDQTGSTQTPIPRPASASEKDRSLIRQSSSPTSVSRPSTPRSMSGYVNLPVSKKAASYRPSTVFFLHWIVQSITQRPKNEKQWSLVISFLSDVCYHADFYHQYLVQQAVTELMVILLHFIKPDSQIFSQSPCLLILDLFSSLSPSVISIACLPLLAGFKLLHETNPAIFSQPLYWTTCLHILQVSISLEDNMIIQEVFPLLQRLTETVHFISLKHPDFLALVNLLTEFSSPDRFIRSSEDAVSPIVNRSVLAIQHLGALIPKVPLLASGNSNPERALLNSQLEPNVKETTNLRSSYYLPPLISLSSLSSHRRQEIRAQAFQQLKRCLTTPNLLGSRDPKPHDWQPIFEKILFPLVDKVLELKSPGHISKSNRESVGEARARVISFISNIFLHFVSSSILISSQDSCNTPCSEASYSVFESLWLEILDCFLRLLQNSKDGEEQFVSILESLKNILLVLTSTGLLNQPANTQEGNTESISYIQRTSTHSWALLDASIPSVISQLFPSVKPEKGISEQEEKSVKTEEKPVATEEATKNDSINGTEESVPLKVDDVGSKPIQNNSTSTIENSDFSEEAQLSSTALSYGFV